MTKILNFVFEQENEYRYRILFHDKFYKYHLMIKHFFGWLEKET